MTYRRLEATDIEGVQLFASDRVLTDPRYPPRIGPTKVGHDAIRQGITWSVSILEQPNFSVRHTLFDPVSGGVAAVEVDTHHELVGGVVLTFTQVFVGEVNDDGRLRRMQGYTPYPPPASP